MYSLKAACFGLTLLGAPAFAAAPDAGHAEAGSPEAHGEGAHGADNHAADGHGDGHAGEGHGGGHHQPDPWADDNHNGTANFLDGEDDHYANSWGHPVYLQWIFHGLNLAALMGVLVWFARKPVASALRERSVGIQKELEDAYAREHEARARYEALEARLSGFEAEVARLRAEAAMATEVERRDIETRAREAAERVKESAERTIRDETSKATRQLRAEAVELAMKLAEDTLRAQVGSEDRRNLARNFLDALGGGKHV
jgi:F-type H+-transporting ATPase subunit b